MTDNIDNENVYHGPNGKFQPGNPGRPVGAKSKARQALKSFMEEQVGNLPGWFEGLSNDRERLEYFTRLCVYVFPRMQAVTFTDEEGKALTGFDISRLSDEDLRELVRIQDKLKGL